MRSALPLAALLIVLSAPFAPAGAVTTSVHAPLTGTVNVTTEVLGVTGSVHVVARCLPTDPCLIHVNLVGVEGEGQTTGQRYLGVGAGSVELPPNPIVPLVLTAALLPVGAPGLPPNPIQPDAAMRVTLTLEFDVASGVLLSVTAVASTPTPGE